MANDCSRRVLVQQHVAQCPERTPPSLTLDANDVDGPDAESSFAPQLVLLF